MTLQLAVSKRAVAYSYLLSVGALFAGFFCATVTIAGNDYRNVLRWGIVFAAVALVLLVFVFARGSWRWQVAAAVSAAPWLLLALLLLIRFPLESRFSTAMAHLASYDESLVQAVQEVTEQNAEGSVLRRDELPTALAAPGVSAALVGAASVSLVLYHNPDTSSGLRVWVDAPQTDYADVATHVPHVYRSSYCNDLPYSPGNRPY